MEYVYVGRINGSHGIKGELKLQSDFLYKDNVFKNGFSFFIGEEKKEVKLSSFRKHNKVYLISFKDFEDINLIDSFKNKDLFVKRSDLLLKKNEYVFEDLLGLKCFYENNYIGTVKDIVNCGLNNYVFYITLEDKEILIPVNNKFIDEVKDDKIIFKEIGGLIDAN